MYLFIGRRRLLVGWILAFSFLFSISSKKYSVIYDGVVKNMKPDKVWEYLIDFNNMKKLNPTILDFAITYDNTNQDNWQYGVRYTEYLHQLPFVKNYAYANYQVKTDSKSNYIISSTHRTCFLGDHICFESTSDFAVQTDPLNPKNTYCKEQVIYECPRIMAYFCFREVMFQRKSIFENLDRFLSKNAK